MRFNWVMQQLKTRRFLFWRTNFFRHIFNVLRQHFHFPFSDHPVFKYVRRYKLCNHHRIKEEWILFSLGRSFFHLNCDLVVRVGNFKSIVNILLFVNTYEWKQFFLKGNLVYLSIFHNIGCKVKIRDLESFSVL